MVQLQVQLQKLISEFKKNPVYWVCAVTFLSLFLRIGGSLLLNNIVSYCIITILLHFGFNDWKKSAIYSAIILVIINLVHHIGYTTEGYDNLDEAIKQLTALGQSQHKDVDKSTNDTKSTTATDKASVVNDNKTTIKQTLDKDKQNTGTGKGDKGVPVVTINGKTQPVEEFNQLDEEEQAKIYKGINKPIKREGAVAQRDLYQLIDTVKQLQETVDNLGPTLKEGKKIMDAFENIKMD